MHWSSLSLLMKLIYCYFVVVLMTWVNEIPMCPEGAWDYLLGVLRMGKCNILAQQFKNKCSK